MPFESVAKMVYCVKLNELMRMKIGKTMKNIEIMNLYHLFDRNIKFITMPLSSHKLQ